MDTKTLISDAKARFNHNAAKSYLKEKYETRLIVAEQGGLWRANLQTINFLNNSQSETVILVDSFENPVEVNRTELLAKLVETYDAVMRQWLNEWAELEKKR
jgi:hypothetical protein